MAYSCRSPISVKFFYDVVPFYDCQYSIVAPFLFNIFVVVPYLACLYAVMPSHTVESDMTSLNDVVMPRRFNYINVEPSMISLDNVVMPRHFSCITLNTVFTLG